MDMRLGILISGNGSNMLNISKACESGELNAVVSIVISNKDSVGIKKARNFGLNALILNPKNYKSKESYEKEITNALKINKVSLVCLAGYMSILGTSFTTTWKNKVINIHPSLLPAFKGKNAQLQALKKGVKYSGCTIHYVTDKLDSGKIIDQNIVKIDDRETEKTLTKKILIEEHKLYIKVLKKLIKGSVYEYG